MPGWSKDRSYCEINASYRPIFSSFGFYDRLPDKFGLSFYGAVKSGKSTESNRVFSLAE